MKKKILSLIFAFCLIIPCAVVFTACDNKPDPIMHTVTFVYGNGTDNSTIEVEEGKFATKPTDPSKTGFTFDGWYVDDFKWNFELVAVMKDTILTAHWAEIPTPTMHSVTFVYGNGTDNSTIQVEEGKFITKPTDPSKTGFTFDGWYVDDFKWNFEYVAVVNDITLTAHWNINTYSITYELDGGVNNESNLSSYNVENNITFAEPTKDKHQFMGWFIDSEFKTEITSTNGHIENLTIFAKWIKINTITYNLNGGTNADNPTTFLEDEEIVLKVPTINDDYRTFAGWFDNSSFSGNAITTIPVGTTQDITLWAKWADIYVINRPGGLYIEITGLTDIGKTLTKLTIPREINRIGASAFANANVLEEVVFDKDSTLYINSAAFANCTKLTSIILPSRTEYIKNYSFSGCINLTSITIPTHVYAISSGVFLGCINLETVVFETGSELNIIGDEAFKDCKKLKNITLPSSVNEIGDYAFESCSALETISIPQNVTSIGEGAFSDCIALKSITFAENCKLTGMSKSVFAGCKSLETIAIPSGVKNIGESAFNGCSALQTVNFKGSQITSIGQEAFKDCCGLTGIIALPNSITSLGDGAFKGCTKLTSIVFGDESNLTYIGSRAFSGCSALTEFFVQKNVDKIGNFAFENCTSLERVIFKDSSTWYKTTSQEDWNAKTNGTNDSIIEQSLTIATSLRNDLKDYYWYKL